LSYLSSRVSRRFYSSSPATIIINSLNVWTLSASVSHLEIRSPIINNLYSLHAIAAHEQCFKRYHTAQILLHGLLHQVNQEDKQLLEKYKVAVEKRLLMIHYHFQQQQPVAQQCDRLMDGRPSSYDQA